MSTLPTGTVTFLFTDIEGSTRLLLRLGERYPPVLQDHHRLIRYAIAASGGAEFGSEGDALFAVFPEASQALEAAINAQRELANHDWPDGGTVRVRMGLHTGEGVVGSTGYTGIDVHRTARVTDAGHGGQILLSEVARSAIEPTIAESVTLRDLGEYRLKDLPEPEHLYQVEIPDLPSDFPPLRALDARPHDLPAVLSEFVGREEELQTLVTLLGRHRLVTLTGPAGSGKTRLAIRVAGDVLAEFSDGVFFVPLEAITDPDLVASAIVQSMGIRSSTARLAIELLNEHVADKHVLLVLDNFEQILPAAPLIGRLGESSPALRVLVTSRAVLHLRGEQSFEVPPLALPDPETAADLESTAEADAVALFVRRAQAVDPSFKLMPENVESVAQIVTRLDGLPLAIELAAARSRYVSPTALAIELEHSLAVLEGGPVDAPDRHRTLRRAIAWSYDLLDEPERGLLRLLGIFAGGFTLVATEAVAGAGASSDVVRYLASLIDKSLVARRVIKGEARFYLLEILRQFARKELETSGEYDTVRGRHAEYYLELAEEAEPELARDTQAAWIERLSHERDNLRAALRYADETDHPDIGLRLGGAIWRYWHGTGQLAEGMQWLDSLLAHPEASPTARAKGFTGLAGLAYWRTDYKRALTSYEEALELYRSIGDRFNEADTLYGMSLTASLAGDAEASGPLAEQAKAMFEEMGDRNGVGRVLMAQASVRWMKGELAEARRLWETSLAISIELGNRAVAASQLNGLAGIQFAQADKEAALKSAREGLEMATAAGSLPMTVFALDTIAVCAVSDAPERSVRLAGAAAALRSVVGGHTLAIVGVPTVRDQAASLLGDEVIEHEWEEGGKLSVEAAIVDARRLADTVAAAAPPGGALWVPPDALEPTI